MKRGLEKPCSVIIARIPSNMFVFAVSRFVRTSWIRSMIDVSSTSKARSVNSRMDVMSLRSISSSESLASTRRRRRSHSIASASVARNASSVAFGKPSMNPMVSASRTRGLASSLPNVDSSVENKRSSTRTSLPERRRNRLDFPALVYPARPTVFACSFRCLRRSAADLTCLR